MSIKHVYYSSHFNKALKRYHSRRKQIEAKIGSFLKNPFDPSLKTHKLAGKLSAYWSFSIDYHLRILFEFVDKNSVGFIDIGTHEIYK